MTEPEPPPRRRGVQLYTKILVGLLLGAGTAFLVKTLFTGEGALFVELFGQDELLSFGQRWIQPVGDLFIRAIVLTVVPLVFTSIATGVHGLGDLRALGRLGVQTLFWFFSTAFVAACIATAAGVFLAPGSGMSAETRTLLAAQFEGVVANADHAEARARFSGSFLEILLSVVPENIALAMSSNRDLLQVILFALVFGVALTLVEKSRAEPVAKVLDGVNEAMTKLIGLLMHLAPFGVFALVFMVVVRFGLDVLLALATYALVVLLALCVHVFMVLMPLVRVFGGWRPVAFLRATRDVWITAFSTSSSSATLPTTIRVVEQNLGVPRPIASFVLPLGATINMDGTTIYQIVAVHFVARVWGVPLDFAAMATLVAIAMVMAVGAAGVPGGVLPLLYVVFATAGIPEELIPQAIALILGIDRVLDMCRSTVNVLGDAVTAVVVARRQGVGEQPPG